MVLLVNHTLWIMSCFIIIMIIINKGIQTIHLSMCNTFELLQEESLKVAPKC